MATIKTKEGQSIWDLTVRNYGTVEDLKKIVSQFEDVTTYIEPLTPVEVEETNNNIVRLFDLNSRQIATTVKPEIELDLIFNSGLGIQYNDSQFMEFNN